jgi:hypothetical protein
MEKKGTFLNVLHFHGSIMEIATLDYYLGPYCFNYKLIYTENLIAFMIEVPC